jgi:GWxTD domain-containing protein
VKAALLALTLAALGAASAGSQVPSETALELATARFYRAASGQTVVDAFCRVPFTILDPLTRGASGTAVYRVAISVRDSAGLELVSQSWTQSVPARMLTVARGSSVEHFSFAAQPGQYTVDVSVTDSASGRVTRQTGTITAYAASPRASDLVLATGMRRAGGAADTAPRPGEIRKGAVFLVAAGRPVLTPQTARLGYYVEVYSAQAETVTVTLRVLKPDAQALVTVPPQQVPIGAGGGATNGVLDLAGLPPGEYRLEITERGRSGTETRSAPFGMAGFETEAALAAVAPGPRDVFDGRAEASLDTLYAPLVYLMTESEQGLYPGLTVDGKRTYLRQFWSKRDPTPGTPRNEAQEDFYSRIAEANRRYREGGAAEIPGWRTDRGRIFVKYGPPDERLARPQAGATNPYEVWKYTRARPLKYVFLDQTQFGNYALIWTDDRREPSRPNWQELLGTEGVTDVERF